MGVELNVRAWWVGTKDSINREGYGALPGRIGGLVRDIKAFYFDEPVVGMVNFGYTEGRSRKGRRALVTGDGQLGRDFSMYDSALRYAAKILSGEIKGDFRQAIEQAKQWKKVEDQILALKDGEALAFLTPKGKETKQGVAFTTVRRVGNKFDLTSRLLPPEIDNDSAIQLFKEFTKDKGELVNFGNEKSKDNALYMGVRGVEIDVKSKEFEGRLRKVLIRGEKSNARTFVPRLLMRTIPVRDFKIEGLRDFRVLAYGGNVKTVEHEEGVAQLNILGMVDKRQLKKTADVSGDERMNVEEPERTGADSAEISAEEEVAVPSVLAEEKKAVVESFEMPKDIDERLKKAEGKIVDGEKPVLRTFDLGEADEESEEVIYNERNTVGVEVVDEKRIEDSQIVALEKPAFEVPEEVNEKSGETEEGLIVFQKVKKTEAMPVISVLIEEKKGEELLAIKPEEFTGVVSGAEDLNEKVDGEEGGSEKVEFISEQISVDGAVDYERENVSSRAIRQLAESMAIPIDLQFSYGIAPPATLCQPALPCKAWLAGVALRAGSAMPRNDIVGEILIPKIILQKPKVFKIPRVISNRVNFGGVWEIEEGRKIMFLDNSFISGQTPLSLTFLVPAILWWINETLLPYSSVWE